MYRRATSIRLREVRADCYELKISLKINRAFIKFPQ